MGTELKTIAWPKQNMADPMVVQSDKQLATQVLYLVLGEWAQGRMQGPKVLQNAQKTKLEGTGMVSGTLSYT